MRPLPLALSIAVLVVVVAVSGGLLISRRRARVSGFLMLGGAAVGASAWTIQALDGSVQVQRTLYVAATMLLGPMAAAAYPRLAWRHPADFVALTTLTGAGVVAVVRAGDPPAVSSMGFVVGIVLIVHVWWRIERDDGSTRESLLWFATAAGTVGLIGGIVTFAAGGDVAGVSQTVSGTIVTLLCIAVPVAMVIGVVRPEVIDVRGVVVWSVVACVTAVVYIAVFAGIVSGLEALGTSDPSPGTLGVVGALCAAGFHPLLVLLRGVVDQLLFGDRPDPLVAATKVVDLIGDDPALALQAIREALVLPYASLRAEGVVLATSGTEVSHTRTLPLQLAGDSVGEVVVGLRAGDLTLAADDEHVLRIVAPLLAQTLRATALARDLQESRGAAITAIEDERRRLRRDLHDGLGPTLTGVAFSADAARNHLMTDAAAADALLERLRADTADAIAEVRRLVEGLRPATLDELGLVGAVRQHAATLHAAEGKPLEVTIDTPEVMPNLPAAAEVAAYRIVVESLTNVARHAGATKVEVRIWARDGGLHLSVRDDGSSARRWTPGVGLSSMRERAELVGGTLVAAAHADGGLVEAVIPLPAAPGPAA